MQLQELRNDDNVSSQGNQMRKQLIAIIALALWLFIIAVSMLLSNRIDLELFFILCFIGVLVIMQFMEPSYVKPKYLRYIRYLIVAGIVIFGLIIALKILDILGFELVI
jgi:hypothetical protein